MSTKASIQAELDILSDEDLNAQYTFIKQCIQSKQPTKPQSLMATLRGIQIDTPPDFAAKPHLYVSGEKHPALDLHGYTFRDCPDEPKGSILSRSCCPWRRKYCCELGADMLRLQLL
jgi:hypothetical protein